VMLGNYVDGVVRLVLSGRHPFRLYWRYCQISASKIGSRFKGA
jgi:hypothetical protein